MASKAPSNHNMQWREPISHGRINYGWRYLSQIYTLPQSEETNSPWARVCELIPKAHLDRWESIGLLLKGPGVLHSMCCPSTSVAFLDHVSVHETWKPVSLSTDTNTDTFSCSAAWNSFHFNEQTLAISNFRITACQSGLHNKYFHLGRSQFSGIWRTGQILKWSVKPKTKCGMISFTGTSLRRIHFTALA